MIRELPVIVLFPHNRCNCRCVMCDIWRIRQVREIRPDDLRPHLDSFRELHVESVVFSGGEAQLNRELKTLALMLREENIHLTLLTAGLLLESRAEEVAGVMDEVIVSLDGPPEVHNRIRNVPRAFERLAGGVEALHRIRPRMKISGRCTVQKANFRHLRQTVGAARQLGLSGISFLASDTTSAAFNREQPWDAERRQQIALDAAEIDELDHEIDGLLAEDPGIHDGFIAESPAKLRRIVLHFRAALGQCEPAAPHCNAPWTSAVIEADGSVRPCFFQPAIGNIHDAPLIEIVNGNEALTFRERLDISSDPICRRCVCSLYRPVRVPTLTGASG
jgi:Fe-coproporphyrin III synthase